MIKELELHGTFMEVSYYRLSLLVAKPKRNVGPHKGVALLEKKKNSKDTLNIIKFIKDFFYRLAP